MAEHLKELTLIELANIPLDRWGYFFPFMIAFWRYLQEQHPGTVGELSARYATEPIFAGEGAPWFSNVLMENVELLDIIEPIAYSILDGLPREIHERGFVRREELPSLADDDFERLAAIIAEEVARKWCGTDDTVT
jgi:hypothetical protein